MKDKDIAPFYSIRQDLYIMHRFIFRLNQTVIPSCLQNKFIKEQHGLGHMGMTKTNTGSLILTKWLKMMSENVMNVTLPQSSQDRSYLR